MRRLHFANLCKLGSILRFCDASAGQDRLALQLKRWQGPSTSLGNCSGGHLHEAWVACQLGPVCKPKSNKKLNKRDVVLLRPLSTMPSIRLRSCLQRSPTAELD